MYIFTHTIIENIQTTLFRGCLASVFKQQFLVFKQYFTYFHTLFHLHVFSQKFLNNNFQFLNTCTKQALKLSYQIGSYFCLFRRLEI